MTLVCPSFFLSSFFLFFLLFFSFQFILFFFSFFFFFIVYFLFSNIDFDSLARLSEGFNGADLRNVCTEAGLFAIRADRECVNSSDLAKAVRKIAESKKLECIFFLSFSSSLLSFLFYCQIIFFYLLILTYYLLNSSTHL